MAFSDGKHLKTSHCPVKEDRSRIRMGHGPENTGLLRCLCLGVLKRDSSKGSLAQKRYRAAMDDAFMMSLLAGALAA